MLKPQLTFTTEWLRQTKTAYINGDFVAPGHGELITSENPATGKLVGKYIESNPAEIEAAVLGAKDAFTQGPWSRATRKDRREALEKIAQLIRDHQGELATLETLDNGKLFSEAYNDDLPEAADVFDYYAGWIDKYYGEVCPVEQGFLNYMTREPVGVCALIVPWNFPLLLAAWKIAPALAMGNTVIVKPSPMTSLSMIRLAEIIHEAGILPAGVFNIVLGGGPAGAALTRHNLIDKVSFTGSTATGKEVVRASADSNLKTVTLELGGKSPNIIFADAPDLSFALERSFTAMFSHKGEKCSEPTRLLVEQSIYGQVVEFMEKKANDVRCGDPFDPATTQGAQCFRGHFDKIMGYIASGVEEGARLVAGGVQDTTGSNGEGLFVRPTIFADVKSRMRIAREEIFGPVLCIMPFSTEDEAVAIANDTTYGLAAGLWTSNLARGHRVARRLDAGQVFVNRYGCYDFASPFGGFKQSGWGKEMAFHSLAAYTKTKSIWVNFQ